MSAVNPRIVAIFYKSPHMGHIFQKCQYFLLNPNFTIANCLFYYFKYHTYILHQNVKRFRPVLIFEGVAGLYSEMQTGPPTLIY